MTKNERDARARVKEQEARLAAYDAETIKRKAKETDARKRLARAGAPATYQRSDGETYDLTNMTSVKPGYLGHDTDRKRLPELIEAGQVKLETDGSTQRAAKTVAKFLRVWTREDARTLASLDARILKLQDTRRLLIKAAWDRGTQLTVPELAQHAARMRVLYDAIPYGYQSNQRGGPDDWERRRIESDIADATIHLRFLTGDMDAETTVCPCHVCRRAANDAAEAAKKKAERDALPTALVFCKLCDRKHRAPFTHGTATVEDIGRVQNAPLAWCDKHQRWLYLADVHEQEKAKAAREQKLAVARDGMTWVCSKPGCHETVTALPDLSEDGRLYVECPVCELADYVIDIKPIGKNARRWIQEAKENAA